MVITIIPSETLDTSLSLIGTIDIVTPTPPPPITDLVGFKMATVSDAFSDIILKAILTRDISVIPSSYFIGLTLELPTDNNGTGIEVPTADEYSRVEMVATDTSWDSSGVGSRRMVSSVDVIFEQAASDWGNIKGYTIYDSLTDGVFLGYGILNPYIILAGTRARLSAGLIAFALL